MKNRILFRVLFLTVLLSSYIYSQWLPIPTINNPISTQVGSQSGSSSTSDGSGGAIIAWVDSRNGNSDIYAQRIDNNGIIIWTLDGVAICTASDVQSSLSIESDGSGGAIITWQDFRNGSDYDIYAQKINSVGIVQWTTDGVPLCTATADQTFPKIVSDGNGGAYVAWQSGSGFNIDIYAQKLSNLGTVLWPGTGVAICTAQFTQFYPAIVSDELNGAIITWNDVRNGIDNNIYAQKLTNSGVQWTANGAPVSLANGNQSAPAIAGDGSNGAIITWQDLRNGNDLDIYAQRINSSGGVAWTSTDVAISTVTGHQRSAAIVSDGLGGAIITWQDLRNGDPDIYAQGINNNGGVSWTADGVAICTASGGQYGAQYSSPTMVSDGSNGAIITWYDGRNSNVMDIYAQGINSSGAVTWAQDGIAISTAPQSQYTPTIVSDGGNGAIITWVDNRNGNQDIYTSKIEQSIVALDSASICGMKFNDLNGNANKDSGELGLSGWEIQLSYNQNMVPVVITDTTDQDGNYCFNNLQPGVTYTVSEVNQSGWTQTFPAAPFTTYTVTALPGQNYTMLFGNQQEVLPGSICGMKFNDLNGDGIQDSGEPGLQNWIINLTYQNAAGSVTLSDTTDINGNYCFNDLQPGGIYTVSETNQSGWDQTFPQSPGAYIIPIQSGDSKDSVNFGNHQTTFPSDSCSYLGNSDFEEFLNTSPPTTFFWFPQADIPYWETNASDGLIEIWHSGFGNVPAFSGEYFAELNATQVGTLSQMFFATASQSVVVSFAHRGRYAGVDSMKVSIGPAPNGPFTDLGTYADNNTEWRYYSTVSYPIANTGAYILKFESISSNNGTGPSDGGNFLDAISVSCPSSICGIKFNDLNGNGIQDSGEPGLENWIINLTYQNAAGTVTLTDTTDAEGKYCFDNLQPEVKYTISETNQTGWTQTFPASPGTYVFNLSPGELRDSVNFGNHLNKVSSTCIDFEDSTFNGWLVNNTLETIILDGTNHYIETTDQSGVSTFFNESAPLIGDWTQYLTNGGCGSLSWDENYLYAGDGNTSSLTVTPSIRIYGSGFSAFFITNDIITAGDGWHSYSAPLALINSSDPLPSNSQGYWVMVTGTNNGWNSMLSNITKVQFSIDPTGYQNERFGFDNICLSNAGDCDSPVSVDEDKFGETLPKNFKLEPNYPNPFNPATIISYQLPKASRVTLNVYDMLGRTIVTLVNNEQAAGNYSVQFDAGSLSSGIYFYKLSAVNKLEVGKNFTQIRKMILIK